MSYKLCCNIEYAKVSKTCHLDGNRLVEETNTLKHNIVKVLTSKTCEIKSEHSQKVIKNYKIQFTFHQSLLFDNVLL